MALRIISALIVAVLACSHAGGERWTNRDGWGSSVETYNRQGPHEVWAAQQLFLGLLAEASWERERRKPKCDFEK